MNRKILYISYDGLTDALGQSQILAYLKRLTGYGNQIVILSYEKKELYEKNKHIIEPIIKKHGLEWVPVPYTKSPPVFSTLYDIWKGKAFCRKIHRRYNFQAVHCRGYIPAILGRYMKKKYGLQFIFDMRAWWADEKIESGYWDKKIYQPVYRYFKKLEVQFFGESDYVVSLTNKGKEEIVSKNFAPAEKIGVIPTCVDFEIFKPFDAAHREQFRKELSIAANEKVFVYSGSLGGNYDPMILVNVFKTFQSLYPESYLLILSKDSYSEDLKQLFVSNGIERVAMYNIPFTAVTNYLLAGDVGFVYYKMSFSTIGRSPTKLGEYWASGLPVISFKGIGDLDAIIAAYPGSGLLLTTDPADWKKEMEGLQFPGKEELRASAKDYFHIDKGVQFYKNVYEHLVPLGEPVKSEATA